MANQTSDNNNNSNNNNSINNNGFNLNSSSSSQTSENITIPRANSVNQGFDNTPNLSQGFNNKNYSMSDSNNNINQNYNPALGQRKNNRNSDLAKPGLDDNDDKNNDLKKNNSSNSDHSGNDSSNDEHNPNKADSNSSMLRHNDDNGINNTNNPYRSNNINNNLDSDNDNDLSKFNKKGINNNNNSELTKQATNNDNSYTDDDKNNTTNSNSSLLNSSFFLNPVMRKRIIISGSIIAGVIISILIFISILNALIVVISTSMCDNGSLGSSYSGSGDVLEFMCGMKSPVENYIVTSKFGYNVDDVHAGRLHAGIDLGVSTGTPVYAVQSGTVVGTDTSSGYGHDVVIDHGGGIFTRFAHNSKLLVSKGDIVAQGQQIAEAGSTGNSTGPHGHFEIMKTTLKDLFSGYQDPNDYFMDNANFMNSCGSSAIITTANSTTTTTTTQKSYSSLKTLKTLSKSTGSTKSINMNGKNPQSFAYYNNYYYVQWISPGSKGKDGYIHKYDSNISFKGSSASKQAVGHGNGLTYSTLDNQLYSVTVSGIRDNTKATIIDPNTLKVVGTKKLGHGTSSIAYDRLTNRFVTSSGAADGKTSSTGYLYVYDSSLSKQVGAKSIAKKRWKTPGDIAAYGGIVYVTISSYGTGSGGNYIDMYNEDTGDYLGSYSAPYSEIEGIDINDNGEIVLLFHSSDFIQFTGIKANVINGSADDSATNAINLANNQCCLNGSSSNTTYASTSSEYCPNGITVTGNYAGTYELDDYIERVVTAENGGAHPEALKALAIAAKTYALNRTDNCKKSIENSTSAQVMAKEASARVKEALADVKGSIMLYNGNYFSAQYSSFYGKCDGSQCTSTFIKTPSEEKATFTMPSTYLTTAADAGHEYGLSQNGSHYMATDQGKTFDEILKFFYADGIEITGVSSSGNSCSLGGSGTYKNGKIWDYNQADYSDAYCGGTIADSGCGPTSMAMVVSTLLNEKHDPTELAKASKVCSTDKHTYFTEAAEKYGLKAVTTKDHEEVMTALNRGDSLVIANVTNATVDGLNNFWTAGGHYIVLAGHDGRDVWVQDPNKAISGVNRSNTKGDGVYNFDKYIKPAATIGYIIIKKA